MRQKYLAKISPTLLGFVITGGVALLVYLSTAARNPVGFGDSDELVGIGYLLGLAHPPGYPLLTILTYVATHIPLVEQIAFRAHLLAGFMQAMTVATVFLTMVELISLTKKNRLTAVEYIYCIIGALWLGFSYLFWLYSNVLEVFPLNNWLSILLFLSSIKLYRYAVVNNNDKKWRWWWYFFWGLLGLMVTHHQTSWLVLPGVGLIVLSSLQNRRELGKRLLFGLLLASGTILISLGLLWWLGTRDSIWTWYFEPSFRGLFNHYFRQAFGGVSIESGGVKNAYLSRLTLNAVLYNLYYYLAKTLPSHLTCVIIPLTGLGAWWSAKHLPKRIVVGFLVTVGLTSLALAAYLQLPFELGEDSRQFIQSLAITERMYLLGYVFLGLLIPLGCMQIQSLFRRISFKVESQKSKLVSWLLVGLGLLLLGWQIRHNYQGVDLKQKGSLQAISQSLLKSTDDGVIVCYSDISCFSLLYQQKVNKIGEGVYIAPIAPQINGQEYLNEYGRRYSFSYQDNPFRLLDIISTAIYEDKVVVVVEMPGLYRQMMMVDHGGYDSLPAVFGINLGCDAESDEIAFDEHIYEGVLNEGLDRRMTFQRLWQSRLNEQLSWWQKWAVDSGRDEVVVQVDDLRRRLGFSEKEIQGMKEQVEMGGEKSCLTADEHIQKIGECKNNDSSCEYFHTLMATLKEPEQGGFRLRLARWYENNGQIELAKREYENSLSIDKENEEAMRGLDRLGGVEDLPSIL